jgi:RNA polymerase sigma factor (sigma-70 family)
MFLLYNFHKGRFADLRSRLDPHLCRRRAISEMERHLRLARDARNKLLEANLRLVVHVARKHLRPGLELMDLVSDGNVVLMRAVEGFDVAKGFKFSTYATMALVKGFARSVPQMLGDRVSHAGEVERQTRDNTPTLLAVKDELDHLLDHLDTRERQVVSARFGLEERDDLADDLGITSRRLRQIEAEALDKLRDVAGVELA